MNPARLSVLIPAAGASRRLGQAKQLQRYGTGTLIQNAINHAKSITPVEIIVVTGAHANEVRAAAQATQVRWIHNPQWPDGLGSSIAKGMEHISPDATGVLVLLCDQWRVQAADLQTLVATWCAAPGRIVAAQAGGRCMPPVIFPPTCFDQMRTLKGDRGARSVLQSQPGLLTQVPLENAAFDLDSPDHLDQLKTYIL